MNRFKPVWQLVLVEVGVLLFLIACTYFHLPVHCPFKFVTGLPCPGCGGTRAVMALLHGQILEAIYLNPLSVLLVVLAIIAPLWLFIDCYRGTNSLSRVMHSPWPTPVAIIIALIILANWIWNIVKGV